MSINNIAFTSPSGTPTELSIPVVPPFTDNMILNFLIANHNLLQGIKEKVDTFDRRLTALGQTSSPARQESLLPHGAKLDGVFSDIRLPGSCIPNLFGSSETWSWKLLFERFGNAVFEKVRDIVSPGPAFLHDLKGRMSDFRNTANCIIDDVRRLYPDKVDCTWDELGDIKKDMIAELEYRLDGALGISCAANHWVANVIFVRFWTTKIKRTSGKYYF